MSRARRPLASLAVTALALAGLAACGDDPDSGHDTAADVVALSGLEEGDTVAPAEFIDTIQDGVAASSTAEVTMSMDMGEDTTFTGDGVLDYAADTPELQMTMTIGGGGQDVDYEVRAVDGLLYVNMGALSGGKFWKLDPSDPASPLAQMGLDQVLDQSDPIGAVTRMEPAIESVTYAGEEDVDGRDLDHYELTVDLAKAIDALGSDVSTQVESQLPDSITYDVWLDDESRFAQLVMAYEATNVPVSMTMTADDWGTDADIEAPPADEVTDAPSFGDMAAD
ncbi:hypothetical protein GON03_02590 [Nocardioides sp. MAH-18]|uniref:LppX_LprAFG lipoprotein n=1 Tax=Nocardioides agri TaxID=2682843 RepID=A0A6L6XMF2_9ACTN|nr:MULTISPECIES: hypothetical protein [unclassified Nocardioides]MBA2953183.1 hypothetical protein [Nocardioides sp. CGMCC 1.13656]MVQ48052.1 hypothetical protein [Nocardioides sp. MAH-18]